MRMLLLNHNPIQDDPNLLKWVKLFNDFNIDYIAIGLEHSDSLISDSNNRILNIKLNSKQINRRWGLFRRIIIFREWVVYLSKYIAHFNPEIIQAANHMSLFALYFCKFNGIKVIYDVNELESEMQGINGIRRIAIKLVEKIIWPQIDAVFFSNESFKEFYFKAYGKKVMTEIVYGTPDLDTIYTKKESEYLRNKFNIPLSSKIFVVSGYITEGRYLDMIIELFSRLIGSNLVLIGFNITEELKDNINQNANIHYHSFISQSELVYIINSADVGLCLIENTSLSYYYSSPQKFWEYHFAGIEVVCSNFPEMMRLNSLIKNGVTIDNSIEELEKIVVHYQDNEIKRNLKELNQYYWKNQISRILNVYDKLRKQS